MGMAAYPGNKAAVAYRSVGRYELREELGEGGMGKVWRAFDSRTGVDVAIKVMKDVSDPMAMDLFAKEWKTLAELSHPNIVEVRDVDVLVEDNEKKPFFVMPLLHGSPLSELIKKSSERLTVVRIIEIISQVCRGLHAAHQRGLVHRDLKPSNIFVMDDDTAKIIDFGVVYLAGSNSITGQKGTYQYMSPEQVRMEKVTPASDIFSLGVILYETLTGRKPFACTTAEDTMQAVLTRIPPAVSELKPGIPHGVSQVVQKCLAKKPIYRFPTSRELSETLQKAARNEQVFDTAKIEPRIEVIRTTLKADVALASELLSELESEGHLDPEITVLRLQIETAKRQMKIRQLMESAQAFIRMDEIPLALDKLREVIELDPENSDALALKRVTERRKGEAQAVKWIELAKTHYSNYDFPAARHAAQEALASRPGDPEALRLIGEIGAMEVESKRVRDQLEKLYDTAVKSYQNGEIDAALNRLDRLFSVLRARPEGAIPERDAVFEAFYREVRSRSDSIRARLEEAQHYLNEGDFAKALASCAVHLAEYPHDSAFQTLKIQIEDAERQKVSSYIATVYRDLEAEPDLDRRVSILREACERYPGEAQFAQQLKAALERRDLVNAIVTKAQQFAERDQYSEALSQWDVLRRIHPRYPGLAFELEQCKKKRDQVARSEEKARQVEDVVSLMGARNFARALERTRLALGEFPGDAELVGLEKLILEWIERSQQSMRIFEEGQSQAAQGNWTEAAESLREALRLDSRNIAAKNTLVEVLSQQARMLLDSNWDGADRLREEAAGIDPNHQAVRSLSIEVAEARRQTYVGECLTQARALVAVGNSVAAYERIQEGLKEYPKDTRLEQFGAMLLKENQELHLRKEQVKRREELDRARQRVELEPDPQRARNLLELAGRVKAQDSDNPETMHSVAKAEHVAKRTKGYDDQTGLQTVTEIFESERQRDRIPSELTEVASITQASDSNAKERIVDSNQMPRVRGTFERMLGSARSGLSELGKVIGRNRVVVFGSAIAIPLLAVFTVLLLNHYSPPPQPPTPAPTKIYLSVDPADSLVKLDGASTTAAYFSIGPGKSVKLEVSRLGYATRTMTVSSSSGSNLHIALAPLPIRVAVTLGDAAGTVDLDGARLGDLVDGSVDGLDIPADGASHTLAMNGGGKHLNFTFNSKPGERPHLDPISGGDLVVISTLGSGATIYGGEQLTNVQMGGSAVKLSHAGTELPTISDQQNELTYIDGSKPGRLSLVAAERPSLEVLSLGDECKLVITSNVDSAQLTVNGKVVAPGRHGGWRISKPGDYNFVLTAANYQPQSWSFKLEPGQIMQQYHPLPPVFHTLISALAIIGGTPGADVVDDKTILGELDTNGAGRFRGSLTAGTHHIYFQKEGFCSSSPVSVVADPPNEVALQTEKLEACGRITVEGTALPVTVRVRRVDQPNAKWSNLNPGLNLIPVGTYQIVAETTRSNGDNSQFNVSQINVESGVNIPYVPRIIAQQHCQLENSQQVSANGDQLKSKDANSLVFLAPGCVNVTLAFSKPNAILASHRKVEWVIDIISATGQPGRIAYQVAGEKLSRQAIAGGPAFDVLDKNIDNPFPGDAQFLVHIRINGSNIRVTNQKGEILDDYSPQNPALHDLSKGKVGVRTNADFQFAAGSGI